MAKLNMVQAINMALSQEMAKDKDVLLLGQDIGVDGGVFRLTEGLLEKYGSERVIDTPLAESAIIGTSIGMAMAGLKPVCEMQFSGFSYLMMGQFEAHATRMRARTHGQFTVPMVIRMPFGGGVRALEHHSESREILYAHLPGAKVVIPSGPRNARALLLAAIRDPDPVVFMEPKHSYRAFREEVPEAEEVMELGKSQVVQEGTDLTLISWGAMMRPALKAAAAIEKERGVSIEIIDLLSIAPLDYHTFTESVKKTGRCVVVQEAPRSFGVSSEVVARINDESFLYLEAPVGRLTGYDVVTPYFGREKSYLPNAGRVGRAIEQTLDY
ncbi:MAG: alpha-ketoacid dehydrogenase subunit beta [Candidatus Krumholzibacteria bacterium]|nr:alpha-ketoacid dehydrogenase subunit beta [Candidatus Krumholzibacteria bacterium]